MGYYPYVCAECGGGDVRCPTGDHEDGDCCGGCWEDECVIVPLHPVWMPRRSSGKPAPRLAAHYEATYGGYGDFTVPTAPSNVAFITADDLSNLTMEDVVRDLDEGVEFLFVCAVTCASCWSTALSAARRGSDPPFQGGESADGRHDQAQTNQKVDAAAAPAPTPAGAAISDEDDSAT